MKDGTVFGIPCYAVDEVYYTFTDASQLKEICAGGGFRLTEETAYYYNYTPSNKDILNTLSENDKITVIDHDGDNAFDVVLVTTSYPADGHLRLPADGRRRRRDPDRPRVQQHRRVHCRRGGLLQSDLRKRIYPQAQLTIAKQTKGLPR